MRKLPLKLLYLAVAALIISACAGGGIGALVASTVKKAFLMALFNEAENQVKIAILSPHVSDDGDVVPPNGTAQGETPELTWTSPEEVKQLEFVATRNEEVLASKTITMTGAEAEKVDHFEVKLTETQELQVEAVPKAIAK